MFTISYFPTKFSFVRIIWLADSFKSTNYERIKSNDIAFAELSKTTPTVRSASRRLYEVSQGVFRRRIIWSAAVFPDIWRICAISTVRPLYEPGLFASGRRYRPERNCDPSSLVLIHNDKISVVKFSPCHNSPFAVLHRGRPEGFVPKKRLEITAQN